MLGDKLSTEEKRWWEVLTTGVVRTGPRLNAAEIKDASTGEIIPKECQMCGMGVDETQEHIMWECPCED